MPKVMISAVGELSLYQLAATGVIGAQNYEPLGVILSRGEGVWLWDTQGNREAPK